MHPDKLIGIHEEHVLGIISKAQDAVVVSERLRDVRNSLVVERNGKGPLNEGDTAGSRQILQCRCRRPQGKISPSLIHVDYGMFDTDTAVVVEPAQQRNGVGVLCHGAHEG